METMILDTWRVKSTYRSYPTYEEWKPSSSPVTSLKPNMSSYPTYEEWKPISMISIPNTSFVLILPMRNGNFVPFLYLFFILFSVLILPMRNGNLGLGSVVAPGAFASSYPTYEEWKRDIEKDLRQIFYEFLSYL